MAGSVREIYGTIKLKDEASKSIDKVDKSLDESTESAIGLQDALKALGGIAVIGAIKSLAGEFIEAFATLETQQTMLKNLANDNYPELKNSIDEAVKASQGLSNEGDLTKAVNQAIKYGASVDLITGGLSSLQKLSAITGEDLSSSMQGLAKDIQTGSTRFIQQNPLLVKHIDAFRKIGAGYDDATKKRREMLVLDLLQKESIAIQQQYNRTLEDTNMLLAIGQSQWGNIKERMGGFISEGLKPMLKLANEVLIWLGESKQGLEFLRILLVVLTPLIGIALVLAFKAATVAALAFIGVTLPVAGLAVGITAGIAALIFVFSDLITWLDGGETAMGEFWQTLADFWNWLKGGFLDGLMALGSLLGIESDVKINKSVGQAQASRAGGGMVRQNQSFIVGEKGAEVFTPGMSGQISPIGASSTNINISVGPFNVSGSEETAREVENAVLRALNNLSDNIFRAESGVPIYG